MRLLLFALPLLTACTFADLSDPDHQQRRGAVELAVKSDTGGILRDIASGGGPVLTDAMDRAGIRQQDRPARIMQLQSNIQLYEATPGALITTLMLYGR